VAPDLSFPPERRLTQSSKIQEILDEGTIFKGSHCHMFRGERDDRPTRAAFVISEKSASRAVLRNRIKRLMRESFRLQQPNLREGWPLVFLATRSVHEDLTRQDFDREVRSHLRDAGILAEEESEGENS
jgi:ribonuclease P protein component